MLLEHSLANFDRLYRKMFNAVDLDFMPQILSQGDRSFFGFITFYHIGINLIMLVISKKEGVYPYVDICPYFDCSESLGRKVSLQTRWLL